MENLNIKLTLSYDGTGFAGFQSQRNCRTVEDEIVKAVSKIINEDTTIYCAGRTDSGVHAEEQVVNFNTTKKNMKEDNYLRAINSILPKDIRIIKCEFVDQTFNARRSAIYREYWYNIIDSKTISALNYRYVSHFFYFKLDENLLQSYGNTLLGENDFTSFCAANDLSESKCRYIHSIKVERNNDLVTIKIIANAFLQHMIRIIVGTMLDLHKKNEPSQKMAEILKAKDRNSAGPTYYSKGLTFKKVYYDETILKKEYTIPDHRKNKNI
jgi:tRNA pseudouridine38-40 synthase